MTRFLALLFLLIPTLASADAIITKGTTTKVCPDNVEWTRTRAGNVICGFTVEKADKVDYVKGRDSTTTQPPPPPPVFNFQAALDKGGTVVVPPGVHKVTGAAKLDNTVIEGADATSEIDCSGMRPAYGKACVVGVGNNVTVRNLKITGAGKGYSGDRNEACLRNEPGKHMVVQGVECYNSNNGILGSGGSWDISNSSFHDNGAGDGKSHNIYLSNAGVICSTAKLTNVISNDPVSGHAVKSRCKSLEITGLVARSSTAAIIDVSEGGSLSLKASELTKSANSSNNKLITVGIEGCKYPDAVYSVEGVKFLEGRSIGNEVVNKCPQALTFTGSPLPANTVKTGNIVIQ